jgi:hypothetical protein
MNNFTNRLLFKLLAAALFILALSSGVTAQSSSAQSSQSSASQGGAQQQTIEGCLIREEHAVYLQPRDAQKTRLNAGDQDLDSHMGQDVRLSGSRQNASAASSTSSGDDNSEFLVTHVDVVAKTCPADIQKQIDKDKK